MKCCIKTQLPIFNGNLLYISVENPFKRAQVATVFNTLKGTDMTIFKLTIAAAALSGLAGFSNLASAQDNNAYVSIGTTSYEFDTVGIDGKLGYNFNDYFGVEGQGIIGLTSDTETIGGTAFKTKVDYTIGGFGVLKLPVSEKLQLFARGGYHQTGVSLETGGIETDADIDGFAYGGGVQFNVSPVSGIRAEYTRLDADFSGLDTFSIGYVRKF